MEDNFNNQFPQDDMNNQQENGWNNTQQNNVYYGQQTSSEDIVKYEAYGYVSLILGIISLATSVLCCGGGIMNVALAIVGLVFGVMSKKRAANQKNAKLGIIFSVISIVLGVLLLIGIIVLYLTGIMVPLLSEISYY